MFWGAYTHMKVEINMKFHVIEVQLLNPKICNYFTVLNTVNVIFNIFRICRCLWSFYNSFTNTAHKCKIMSGFRVVSFKIKYHLTWCSVLFLKED